ncbi:hypothetical protein AGMMS50262_03170 [Bacteroidia bacterium]|nr:hypothetical protein AGMMS50262_03170 [Bacteroidia bacterium]
MNLEKVTQSDHVQGQPNAVITLIEYADYQCPYCRQAHYIVKDLQKRLGDRLQVVFRNYPLQQLHPHAVNAAIAAETAAVQQKFWEMNDMLFDNQRYLDDASLVKYAKEIGIDIEKFKKDFGSQPTIEKVEEDIESGNKAGVEGTPTFFVNGRFFDGNWTNHEFLDYLQSLL